MNSEHINNPKLKYIVEKYNISSWEHIDKHKYKFEIFNGHIITDIYNFYKTLSIYEEIKEFIHCGKEILLNTYIKDNYIWLKIQTEDQIIYDTNLKGYKKMLTSRNKFNEIVNKNNHILLSSYIDAKRKVLIDFNCGHPPNYITPNSYLNGTRCPYCSNRVIKPYINDCYTLRKDLLKYFINEQDAVGLSPSDRELRLYKCPECNSIRYNTLGNIDHFGFSCYECGDGVSYPEKMMKKILEYLGILFSIHKQFDWCVYELNNKKHHGIFDFVLDNYKVIIEMDGSFHNIDNHFSGNSKEYAIQIDNIKDELAKENGYEVIRVNCCYGKTNNRFEYIKQNILTSLSNILNLNNIIWDDLKMELELSSSLLVNACNLWNDGYSVPEISEIIKINKSTIISYLTRGNDLNLCCYNKKIALQRRDDKVRQKYYQYVKVIQKDNSDNSRVIGIYYNTDKFINNMYNAYKIQLSKNRISEVVNTSHTTKNMYFLLSTKDEYDYYKTQNNIVTD